jgi:hypothetical protein
VPLLVKSGNLARRSARVVVELLLIGAFLLGSNTKFVWKFLGSSAQALEINTLRLSLCDSCPDADGDSGQDCVSPPPPPSYLACQLSRQDCFLPETELAIEAPSRMAPNALWHRPPPFFL